MREALRRTLWLIPTVFVVSLGVFWLLSRMQARELDARTKDYVPLFFNPSDVSVGDRAKSLADTIARADRASAAATRDLRKLGGAALPTLIPYFDSLSPLGRGRVALALAPLAERMEIPSSQDLEDPEAAVLFWTRYWADHAIDFRASMVGRVVERIVVRPAPARRAEVLQLDTYALDALITGIGKAKTVDTLSELTDLAAHITETEWRIGKDAPVAEANRIRDTWLDWWVENRSRYTSYEGGSKVLGMFQETRYGRWVTRTVGGRFGFGGEGASLEITASAVGISLVLLTAGLLGGYVAGPLLAALAAGLGSRRRRSAVVFLCLFLASLPSALVLSWLRAHAYEGLGLGALLMFVFGASLIGLYQYQAIRDTASFDYTLTHRAFGATRLRTALTALRTSGLIAVAHLANRGPSLFTGICIVEYALGLHGLGQMTVQAVHDSNVSWLMFSACFSTVLAGLLQITGDLWLQRFATGEEHL